MKLVVLYLLAVCCYSFASTSTVDQSQRRKLEEVLRQFNDFENKLQPSDYAKMLGTPKDFADCCSLSAFQCFRSNLEVSFDIPHTAKQLSRSLSRHITERAMNFCASGTTAPNCTDCLSQPMQNGTEFLKGMKSLIQHAISRQTN